jgi:hypothetical protein
MSPWSKKEYIEITSLRYTRAPRKKKSAILDEFWEKVQPGCYWLAGIILPLPVAYSHLSEPLSLFPSSDLFNVINNAPLIIDKCIV